MDQNLTINARSFVQQYNDRDAGSVRVDTSEGINLPTTLTIKSQRIVDSATKIPGRRTVVRIDKAVSSEAGDIVSGLEAHVVVTVPTHAAVETADVQAIISDLLFLLGPAAMAGALDLRDEIFVNQEQ